MLVLPRRKRRRSEDKRPRISLKMQHRVFRAQETCETCAKCGRNLQRGEPAWRVRISIGRIRGVVPVCEQCKPSGVRILPPYPCEHCGRTVLNEENERQYSRKRVYCSLRCRAKLKTALKKREREGQRQRLLCRSCGKQNKTLRMDTVYCSNACRQRDYRRRKLNVYRSQ